MRCFKFNLIYLQGLVNISSTFDSRTRDVESSLVARGDFWRMEASRGSSTSGNENPSLFLVQLGPVLFVRDSTLLLPVHLSKQHLLWYGYDRKVDSIPNHFIRFPLSVNYSSCLRRDINEYFALPFIYYQNGMHSLCPAVWSKHRRWLLMSMVCLNPLACVSIKLLLYSCQVCLDVRNETDFLVLAAWWHNKQFHTNYNKTVYVCFL